MADRPDIEAMRDGQGWDTDRADTGEGDAMARVEVKAEGAVARIKNHAV